MESVYRNYNKFRSALLRLKVYSKRESFRFGIPFVLFVVGGSFGLREWTQIRYQFSQVKSISKEKAEEMGLHKARKVSLEDVYEEIKNIDVDNWENKRGPRPWETPQIEEKTTKSKT